MLTFKEFIISENLGSTRYGTGTGRTMSLRTGMLHNRQASSRMYSPKPPIGVDFDAWLHHNINNIANVLENLYHRYEAGDLVTVNGKLCVASSEIEHWHEATVKKLIFNGVLKQMPVKNIQGFWLDRDLSDSVPSFQHHMPIMSKDGTVKSKSMFVTTRETVEILQRDEEMRKELLDWIKHGRMAERPTILDGVIFYEVNTQNIVLFMQKQQDIFKAMNLAGEIGNLAFQPGTFKPDPNKNIYFSHQ